MVTTKLDLGSLFVWEEEKPVPTLGLFEAHPLTSADVRAWRGPRGGVEELVENHADCAGGLRESGALLDVDMIGHGQAVQALAFTLNGTLYLSQSKVLTAKAPKLFHDLRDSGGEAMAVYITSRISKAGRKYWDFETLKRSNLGGEQPQTLHPTTPSCIDGLGGGHLCLSSGKTPDGKSLICTRKRGHTGLHHGAIDKNTCIGSWQ